MDSTITSDKHFLFAYCITDGALYYMTESQRTSLILAITEIKDEILNDYHAPKSAE